jgi:hypothetical protein
MPNETKPYAEVALDVTRPTPAVFSRNSQAARSSGVGTRSLPSRSAL